MELTNKELANLYIKYKKQKKYYKQKERLSMEDINNYLESKRCLSILKIVMKQRGLKKKEAKKISNY